MSGSVDRIQVEIRSEGPDGERIKQLVVDVGTVSGADGRPAIVEVVTISDRKAAFVVVGPDNERAMLRAVDDGAMGYVIDTSSDEDLAAALETIAAGAAVIPPMMLGALLRHTVQRRRRVAAVEERLQVLTEREREVIEQVSSGEQRQLIAQRLNISPATVRTHIQRAMAKLGVHSQNELMALLAPLEQGGT